MAIAMELCQDTPLYMPKDRSEVLQSTLDLMVLKTLDALGPLHGYGIARRIDATDQPSTPSMMVAGLWAYCVRQYRSGAEDRRPPLARRSPEVFE